MTSNSNNDKSGWERSLKNKNKPHTHKKDAEEKKNPTAAKSEGGGGKSDQDFFFFSPFCVSGFWFVGWVLFPPKLPVSVPLQTG